MVIGKHILMISSSMGISVYPENGKELSILLEKADTALYRAKEKGKNNFQYFR